jgi:hypothetical protein
MAIVEASAPAPTVIAPHRRWGWPLPPDVLRPVRAQLALELAGARIVVDAETAQPGLELAGARAAWAALVTAVVYWWPHVLVRPWQSNAWGRWWRELTDTLTAPTLLAAAICWALLWAGLAVAYSGVWFLAPVAVAVPSLAFGLGRYTYPHTTRGRVRARFDPHGFADWGELRYSCSAFAVRRHAAATRPAIARRARGER